MNIRRISLHALGSAVFLVLSFTTVHAAKLSVTTGNSLKAFFWTQATDDGSKNGCYGYAKIGDPTPVGAAANSYTSTFWFPTYGWWRNLFPNVYLSCTMLVSDEQPAIISRASGHFSSTPWFSGFSRNDTAESVRFYFPLLPQKSDYDRYDYFTIDVDSATVLDFYGAGDSIMVGSFIAKEPDPSGGVNILARNAIIVELTKSNPLRVGSIRLSGEFKDRISAYIGYDLTRFSDTAAWYGIDFIDTSSPPVLNIYSIELQGTMPLTAQTTSSITWTLEGDSIVDSCLIYVSFDSTETWNLTGKVINESSYNWTVPLRESSTAFIKVTAFGTSGETVSSISDQFSTALADELTLTLQPIANANIIALWNPSAITTPKAKAVCLAFKTGNAAESFPATGVDTLLYPLSVSQDTITGLATGTLYYFTAFVLDSTGAFTLTGPEAIDSAYAEDRTPPDNPFSLTALPVDSNRVYVTWNSSENDNDINQIGIWYNKFHYPTEANDNASIKAGIWDPGESSDTITGLLPATTYYFSLFVADSAGNWSAATSQSMAQLRTPAGNTITENATTVTIFGTDTQSVFGDTVKIWSRDLKASYTDTIDPWSQPPLEGFISVGPAFNFRYGMLSGGATVSFALLPGKIPSGYTISDIGVYRYNIYTGGIRIDEGDILVDTSDNNLIVTTDDIRLPFILMIDTLKPEVSLRNIDSAAYGPQQSIIDTFMVSDNIENPSITLLAGAGSLAYSDISLYAVAGKKKDQYITTIPAYVADPNTGLRSLFVVDDGRNADSINLSRRIVRTTGNCDDTQVSAMTWSPITVTALPDRDDLGDFMAAMKNEKSYGYNTEEERIIQWLPNKLNKSSTDKWVDYSSTNDSLFTLAPGKLFWIKSKENIQLSFGRAVIPALIDTFEITLAKGEWTDFSLPYNFSIYSGDIIDATGKSAKAYTDSIELYQWNPSSKSFMTDPLHLPGIDAASDPHTIFEGGGAFTAFNPSGKTIKLRIPPVCTPLSSFNSKAALKKRTSAGIRQWSVKLRITGNDNFILPPMYCASVPEDNIPRYYSCPPSLLPVSAAITDPVSHSHFGHVAAGTLMDGGTSFQITYTNSSGAPEIISDRIETTTGLPREISARLFQKSDRGISALTDSNSMVLSPHSTATGYLIIGTQAFMSDFVQRITSVFSFTPFTANRALRVCYSLPTGVRKMSLSIFDLKGRRVEQLVKEINLHAGEGLLDVKSHFSPGYYVVQMLIETDYDNKPLILNKRWMYVR